MPYRERLQFLATENPEKLLTVWRQERAFRIGKILCYSGIGLSLVASIADAFWSDFYVLFTDLILLFGCVVSLFWIKSKNRPTYYWLPVYLAFWVSILPSLWTTGGISSPFFAVDLAVLYVVGAVMDVKNRSGIYMTFALMHIPVFWALDFLYPLFQQPNPPLVLTATITGVTLAAVFICVHAMLKTERELSTEFAEHYRELFKTEENLMQSEGRLREAQSIARIGSWEWNLKNDLISWSDELFKIFEVDKQNFDPSFKAYLARLKPEMREQIHQTIQRSIETGKDFVFENHITTTQGNRVIFSSGRVVGNAEGQTVKMLGTSQDITERKRIESELLDARNELEKRVEERTLQLAQSLEREKAAKELAETASQAKMQFLANMSHEIRTPMNSIIGFSELLGDRQQDAEGKEYVERIRSNGKQLLHLIDDILDLSKFEAGKIPVHMSNFSLKFLLEDVTGSFRPVMKEKGIEFILACDFLDSLRLITDMHRVKQILNNLLSNSIKFSDGGKIKVGVRCQINGDKTKGLLKVDVLDSGIGISAKAQEKLFQPFSQGDPTVARKFGGSGLGLALSKRIAEALGGKLELKESHPGKGSHFQFEIPVEISTTAVESAKPGVALNVQTGEPMPFRGKKILVAEDSPDNAFLIRHYLGSLGAEIDLAPDGLRAVEMAAKTKYDCVLMDIQMPGMDGLEATRKIREQGFRGPIVALTAHALPIEASRSLAAGCDRHLTKPIYREELIHQLISVLQ